MKYNNLTTLLVPIDFSQTSLNALKTAITLAKQHNAKIILLNVVDSGFVFHFKGAHNISVKTVESLVGISERMLEPLSQKIRENKQVNCTSLIKVGLVPQSIITTAHEVEADLIIMGTYGVSGSREFFIGSTTLKVLKLSPCSVLTIPKSKKWKGFKKVLFPVKRIKNGILHQMSSFKNRKHFQLK